MQFVGLPDPCSFASALDLDTYCGGVDHLGEFPLFLKVVAYIIATKLSIIFLGIISRGSFPVCWLSANVTVIPKGAPSPDRKNYRLVPITPILSKVYEKLVSHMLSSFCEKYFLCLQFSLVIGKVWAALMHC